MSAELREEDELVESEIFEKLSKTSRGTTEQSITNAVVVLENDSNFKNKIKSLQKTKAIEYKILICAKFAQFWTILRNTFRSIFEYGFYETEAKID